MAYELGEAIRRCGLESGARRAVIDALACYTDADTRLARVSRVSIALHAGVSEKTVQRLVAEICADPELEGLVRLVREAKGRGNPAVYRVDIDRLEPLSDAIKAAGRKVFAGVGKRLFDRGLVGRKASRYNIRAVFRALDGLLEAEGQLATRALVKAHCEAFEEALLASGDVTLIGRKMPERDENKAVDSAHETGTSCPRLSDEKGDILSGKGDISSREHSIDNSPSGNIPLTRDAGEGAHEAAPGRIVACAASDAGEMIFTVEGVLAHATVNRRERLDLTADLDGRIVRVNADGVVIFRARSIDDAEAIGRWITPLTDWTQAIGLAGVAIDRAFDATANGG